ncbi:MAG: cobalamin-binding protein [Geobacteraceae bacterium GWC2_55_20]|nr:MAG: cobalamin-binding protein [Geobacteraceae bacterium GWC2_55_20]HBA72562.1 cobalamin-binding protein [Geobacter sp.]HCE67015.1 cobalamin-binding protein [Geobacter sp.]
MLEQVMNQYNEAIMDTDRDRALMVVRDALDLGISPEEVVFRIVVPAIELMMKSISENQGVSLAQHFMAAQIASEVVDEMVPRFQKAPEIIGKVVIGTSQGDFHGLGKRIVSGCLKALMIEVSDLGLNVAPERFVDEALAHDAQVIAISSMMVHTARGENGCSRVRQILKERGLEGLIRIAVGGAPYRFDPELYRTVGADAWAENGIEAGKVISNMIREVRK